MSLFSNAAEDAAADDVMAWLKEMREMSIKDYSDRKARRAEEHKRKEAARRSGKIYGHAWRKRTS